MMKPGEKQLEHWRGQFGDAYIERNTATAERVQQRAVAFGHILQHVSGAPLRGILEVGANIGLNIRALQRLTTAELHAVEPNRHAREILVGDGVLRPDCVHAADASELPFPDTSFDLAFTCTVLIHVPDEALQRACREIHRVSRRWILCMEYFSPTPVMIPYRGRDDLLFKRDYGALWLDGFSDLEHVANGFFWKRTTGLDDVNWWLFRKTS
jgi:pseudaminic acid biosynthesis-associated methylase